MKTRSKKFKLKRFVLKPGPQITSKKYQLKKNSYIHGKSKYKLQFEIEESDKKKTVEKKKSDKKNSQEKRRKNGTGNFMGEKGSIAPYGNSECWACHKRVARYKGEKDCFASRKSLQQHMSMPPKYW